MLTRKRYGDILSIVVGGNIRQRNNERNKIEKNVKSC